MALIQKTVYIREEDIEAWKAVPNKAQWISSNLNTPKVFTHSGQDSITKIDLTSKNTKQPKAVIGYQHNGPVKGGMFDRDVKFCKHDLPKDMCEQCRKAV